MTKHSGFTFCRLPDCSLLTLPLGIIYELEGSLAQFQASAIYSLMCGYVVNFSRLRFTGCKPGDCKNALNIFEESGSSMNEWVSVKICYLSSLRMTVRFISVCHSKLKINEPLNRIHFRWTGSRRQHRMVSWKFVRVPLELQDRNDDYDDYNTNVY